MTLATIRLYNQEKDKTQLEANAAADNHGVFLPTHVLEGDKGKIIGYFSAGAIPTVLTWMSTTEVGALDSVHTIGYVKGLLSNFPMVMFPCDPKSPFNPYMEKLGMIKVAEVKMDLFVKVNN